MDSTGFQRGIQRSKQAVGKMQKAVVGASNALAKMGLASASAAVLLLSRNAIQLGSYLSDVAESTGFATREFQVFRGALIDAGGKAENMEKAITLMQKAIVQGSEGMTTYTRAFERLGLNVDDLRKMKPEDQFQAIGKAIAGASDQQGALTAAIEIFGQRNAPRLIEVFKRLDKDGYGKMAKDIEAAYGIMDAATQKALDRAADQIERFKNKATIKVGELIAGEADGAALKILGLSISKAGAQLGVGMVNGIMDSIAFARNSFGATADWLYSKLSSSFEMIGIQFKLAMIESANVVIEAANKISKLTLFETIDTGKVYDNLRQALKDSNKEWFSFFDERMSKQEKFDMVNRFGYDPGKFYDEAIDEQRQLLQESRQVADNISEAFGTTREGAIQLESELTYQKSTQLEIEKQITAEKQKQNKAMQDGLSIGIKGFNAASLSEAELKYILQESKKQINKMRRNLRPSAYASVESQLAMTGGAAIQNQINEIEKELATRRKFEGLSAQGRALMFDPFQQKRLEAVTNPPANKETLDLLKDIKTGISGINQITSKLDRNLQ